MRAMRPAFIALLRHILLAMALCIFPIGCSLFPRTSPTMAVSPPATPFVTPKIDRYPAAYTWYRKLIALPILNPDTAGPFHIDLRSADVSELDLSSSSNELLFADFDTKTKWPGSDAMPGGFDWQRIMELGKNPGLGIRSLQMRGITGRGVSIAIIDQPLLVDHQDYADRVQLYEEINIPLNSTAAMHGPAVASLAVGKTVGVAPEANLYYIAVSAGNSQGRDFHDYAKAIHRILEINQQLPPAHKIRVISLSIGWAPGEAGYAEVSAAAQEAKAAGLFVVSSSIDQTHGFQINGLGRQPMADPDLLQSYEAGLFWAKQLPAGQTANQLMIPMDSRTAASFTGKNDYVFFREGGWSWITPYLAGVFALAVQVDPSITPDRFWSTAMQTARTIEFKRDGRIWGRAPVLNPVALIAAMEKR